MLDGFGYPIAWVAYTLATLGLFLVFRKMISFIPSEDGRKILQGFFIALFLTPVDIGVHGHWFAPAWLISTYEAFLGNVDVAVRAGLFMLGAFLIIVMMLALEAVVRKIMHMS